MYKKIILLIVFFLYLSILTGCEKNNNEGGNSIADENSLGTATTESENDEMDETTTSKDNNRIDVDLTLLSSTMVYAEVYNMMISPNDYVGKTIKMSGPYYASYYDKTEKYHHYIIIEDATACCTQGIEFVLSDDYTYPEDYPEENTIIEVIGVFNTYEELGNTYFCLSADSLG